MGSFKPQAGQKGESSAASRQFDKLRRLLLIVSEDLSAVQRVDVARNSDYEIGKAGRLALSAELSVL
jgi:hypothetical protein